MAGKSTKLIDLISANIKKGDKEKEIAKAEKEVRRNKQSWSNEIFKQQENVDASNERVETLSVSTSASAADVVEATRAAALAQKTLEEMEAANAARF